ncbi:MAG: UDP-N-acetylmuramoylalanyl-D-glutamyl-2,6-diaminopimelate--D-alanyl-D-alanine ligase, partial [Aliidongia sp.]
VAALPDATGTGAVRDATGVSIDSRSLESGDVFVALIGPNADGHAHVAGALARGAAAAIVARVPDDLSLDASLIRVADTQTALEMLGHAARARSIARITAITGSVGKTGTKEMLATVLAAQQPTHRSVASHNNQWGVPLSLARLPRDARFGVFELGMNHSGEIAALTRQVRPDVAIITTVEAAHLEFFGGIEAIADAKAEIFQGMTPDGAAILNGDNPMLHRLAEAAATCGLRRILSFGTGPTADIRLIAADADAGGSTIEAEILGHRLHYRLGQPGHHLVMNSLAVLGAVSLLGADLAKAGEALSRLSGLAGRGRQHKVPVGSGEALLIDESYNASPASMRAAFAVLAAACPHANGRRIAVLGDMRELGDEAPSLHAALAEPLESAADLVFTAGPLMRHLYEALAPARQGAWQPDAAQLLPLLLGTLRPGDVVTVKGSLGSRMIDIVKPLLAGAADSAPIASEKSPC